MRKEGDVVNPLFITSPKRPTPQSYRLRWTSPESANAAGTVSNWEPRPETSWKGHIGVNDEGWGPFRPDSWYINGSVRRFFTLPGLL